MSSASVVQLALEESKRQLKKADEKRKATQAEVEGLLAEIEAVRADMCQRSQRHAERQSEQRLPSRLTPTSNAMPGTPSAGASSACRAGSR